MPIKPFLSFSDQARLLIQRGMESRQRLPRQDLIALIEADLRYINYYRFSAYWHPFRIPLSNGKKSDVFQPNTHWETIRSYYMFDRKLRSLVFEAISRIEIALRTQIAHIWAKETNLSVPQKNSKSYRRSFTTAKNNSPTAKSAFAEFLDTVDKYYKRSNEDFAVHHRQQYGIIGAKELPIWVFVEFTTFGNLASLLTHGLQPHVCQSIATNFGFRDYRFFISCINLLNDVRNTCAHQGRIWNRVWLSGKAANSLKRPRIPEWDYVWNDSSSSWCPPTQLLPGQPSIQLHRDNNRTATVLTVCRLLLKHSAAHSSWPERIKELLNHPDSPHPDIYKHIGFGHQQWLTHDLWK
ncbi:MAG: Abi family protein [Akkermansia sp.]|nr:Abi family protein [Akkermansia sp.]